MAGDGALRREDVMMETAVKEVVDVRAAFKERLARFQAARRPQNLGRMTRRGDVKRRIRKDVVETPVKKLIKLSAVRLVLSRAQPPLRLGGVDSPPLEGVTMNEPHEPVLAIKNSVEVAERETVNEPHEPIAKAVLDLVELPAAQSSEAPPTNSSQAVDKFLQASPFPTRKDGIIKQWPKVDMSRALEHKGSVLYEEQKGKWTVLESSCDYSDTVVVPLFVPSLRVPTPL